MTRRIVGFVLALVALFAIYVATRPGTYRIARSGVVTAPPSDVYARVADFRRWEAWSPWAKLDPAMKVDYAGTQGSVGGSYYWKGNDKVGEGRMTIVSASPDRHVAIRLEFMKPWAQESRTEFTFEPDPGGTRVTWAMSGEHDLVGKLFSVFMDMDKMVGSDFDKGLTRMRETQPK